MSDEAVIFTVESVRTRASTNEGLVTLAVPLENSAVLSTFLERIGQQVAAAFVPVDSAIALPVPRETKRPGEYGEYAAKLKTSGFCLSPAVWGGVGTDGQYLEWLRRQCCAVCFAEPPSEAAHVRRIASGAGTGIKPAYAAISLCHAHHAEQHQLGESVLGGKDKADFLRLKCVEEWAWATLKATLGYDSMAQVPPAELLAWARAHGVRHLLPAVYREFSPVEITTT